MQESKRGSLNMFSFAAPILSGQGGGVSFVLGRVVGGDLSSFSLEPIQPFTFPGTGLSFSISTGATTVFTYPAGSLVGGLTL